MSQFPPLWPAPRNIRTGARLVRTPHALARRPASDGLRPEGYRLHIAEESAWFEAADEAGARHAQATWAQLSKAEVLPELTIEDWPDFAVRGVMLDVSRCKVPTLATLFRLVEFFASLKLNQLQLYTEHTFAFPGHEQVWGASSPLTPEEVRALDAHCASLGIELVPNFNSFGHFERWLRYPDYHHLAECPGGYSHPSGEPRPFGSTLKPNEETLAFLGRLQESFLPCFRSRSFNIGCDETWELGQGWSGPQCEARGKHRVYADFLLKLHKLSARFGHRIQFWADIILHEPALIAELPRELVGLVWGYEANHPFADQCPRFAAAGLDFIVCPGTSGWNSLGGRTDNMLANQAAAALNARSSGARGLLNTDWGDGGHPQPLAVSISGYVVGAGRAWRAEVEPGRDALATIGVALDFLEPAPSPSALALGQGRAASVASPEALATVGELLLALGRLSEPFETRLHNSSGLHHLLFAKDYAALARKLPLEVPAVRKALEAVVDWQATLAQTAMPKLAKDELTLASDLMALGCRRWLAAQGAPTESGERLRGRFTEVIGRFEEIWLARNRPGGLHESSGNLRALLATV